MQDTQGPADLLSWKDIQSAPHATATDGGRRPENSATQLSFPDWSGRMLSTVTPVSFLLSSLYLSVLQRAALLEVFPGSISPLVKCWDSHGWISAHGLTNTAS